MAHPDHLLTELRLQAVRAAVRPDRPRREPGGALMDEVLLRRGIGDWTSVPRAERDVAFACRLSPPGSAVRARFRRLVRHVESHASRLLHPPGPVGLRSHVLPLLRLAGEGTLWQVELERWHPPKGNASRQILHLVQTLLGREAGERFLGELTHSRGGAGVFEWLKPLHGGRNVRTLYHLPVYLTTRMQQFFVEAAERHDLIRALRWGQLRGLGGSPELARALMHCPLGAQLWTPEEERWWLDALVWCAAQPDLEPYWLVSILDYAAYRRYGDEQTERPADPLFRLSGRAVHTLLDLVEARPEARRRYSSSYRASGISEGRWTDETDVGREEWTIQELLQPEELVAEGRWLQHCVATYAASVAARRCSIWGMRVRRGGVPRRAVTIQVRLPERKIVQCRGRANRAPTERERAVLERWAAENGLECGIRL